jgi:hypothetical protein
MSNVFSTTAPRKACPVPVQTQPPTGTLHHATVDANMSLLQLHVVRQNGLAREATNLCAALNKSCDELDAVKQSSMPDSLRAILRRPTAGGVIKELTRLRLKNEELQDRWKRLQDARGMLNHQEGVTKDILWQVDEEMQGIEQVIALVNCWMEEAVERMESKLNTKMKVNLKGRNG